MRACVSATHLVVENLLEHLDTCLLKVDCGQINGFVCMKDEHEKRAWESVQAGCENTASTSCAREACERSECTCHSKHVRASYRARTSVREHC